MNHSGVQGLIQIGPRHGDVIFEPAGHRAPDVVNHTKRGITVFFGIGDQANGKQIVDLFQAALLALQLAMQRIQAFDARFKFGRNTIFHQLGTNLRLHLVEEFLVERLLFADFFLKREK